MGPNTGFHDRREIFRKRIDNEMVYHNNYVSFIGQMHSDLNSSDTGIPPGCMVKIDLDTTDDNLRLMCTTPAADARLEIGEMLLHVPVATLNDRLFKKLSDKWAQEDMKIFYTRLGVIKHQIARGDKVFFTSQAFAGNDTNPCRCWFFFLTNDQLFPRDKQTNPYELLRLFGEGEEKSWVESMQLEINGQPITSLTEPATEDDDLESYLKFNLANNSENTRAGTSISYKDWMTHSAIWGFDLSSSGRCSDDYWVPTIMGGNVSLKVIFSKEIPHALTLMCIQEIPSLTTIQKAGCKLLNSYFAGTNPRPQ